MKGLITPVVMMLFLIAFTAGSCCEMFDECCKDDDCYSIRGPDFLCNENNQCEPRCGSPCTLDTNCGDNIACTNEVCYGGCCQSIPVDSLCNDGIDCTADSCSPNSQNSVTGVAVGTGCAFTPQDSSCDDGIACTEDICDPSNGCQNLEYPPGEEPEACGFEKLCNTYKPAWPVTNPCTKGDWGGSCWKNDNEIKDLCGWKCTCQATGKWQCNRFGCAPTTPCAIDTVGKTYKCTKPE